MISYIIFENKTKAEEWLDSINKEKYYPNETTKTKTYTQIIKSELNNGQFFCPIDETILC